MEDLIWYYPEPLPEATKVKEHLSFHNERVDLEVDDKMQHREASRYGRAVPDLL